jgi:hypothetical protein
MKTQDEQPARSGAPGVLSALFSTARTAVREGRVPRVGKDLIVHRDVSVSRPPGHSISPPQTASERVTTEAPESLADCPLEAPILGHILVHDLRDTERLLHLYEQTVEAGLIGPAEADRLTFVALAQHVLAYRPDNAGGLFTQLLRTRQFDYITQDDEETAQQRLKRVLYQGSFPVLRLASAAAKRKTK